jgi:uncharacterized UPF0160 family protein
VVGKHVKAAMAFMGAVASNAVDKASLFAKERERGDHYLVSETFKIKSDEVEVFQIAQREGRLQDEFSRLIFSREDSILKLDAAASGTNVHTKIGKMPNFNEKNIAYLTSPASDGYTLLAIYDVKRFVELVEKGLKNPHASKLAGLDQLPASAPFVTGLAR